MKRTILTAVSLLILFVLPPHLSAGPQSWQQAQKIAERIGCQAKNSVAPMTPGNVFLKMGDKETVVPLKLTNWGDTGNNIRVKTQVEPCMLPDEGETFAIGYVMTASGLSDDKWRQESNYAEYSSDSYKDAPEEMKFYADAANYVEGWSQVKGMVYNHVAIESQGMDNGLEDSKMTDFRADEVKTHSTTFEGVNKYSVIRDRSKIEIAAVLFNTKTGKIENAARCSVRNHGTTGIRPNLVQEQKKNEGIYDMQGRKVNGKPTPGIYIVNGKKTVIR